MTTIQWLLFCILVIVLLRRNNRCTPPHMVPPTTRSPPNRRRLTDLQMDFQSLALHDGFVAVKVCNLRTPLKWGSCITQELCFQVTLDAFLCHVLSGFSTVLVSPNRFYT